MSAILENECVLRIINENDVIWGTHCSKCDYHFVDGDYAYYVDGKIYCEDCTSLDCL